MSQSDLASALSSSVSAGDHDEGQKQNEEHETDAGLVVTSPIYPLYFVYETEEQTLREDALRRHSKENFSIPPLPPLPPPSS
jgi:hypothetical protein